MARTFQKYVCSHSRSQQCLTNNDCADNSVGSNRVRTSKLSLFWRFRKFENLFWRTKSRFEQFEDWFWVLKFIEKAYFSVYVAGFGVQGPSFDCSEFEIFRFYPTLDCADKALAFHHQNIREQSALR